MPGFYVRFIHKGKQFFLPKSTFSTKIHQVFWRYLWTSFPLPIPRCTPLNNLILSCQNCCCLPHQIRTKPLGIQWRAVCFAHKDTTAFQCSCCYSEIMQNEAEAGSKARYKTDAFILHEHTSFALLSVTQNPNEKRRGGRKSRHKRKGVIICKPLDLSLSFWQNIDSWMIFCQIS